MNLTTVHKKARRFIAGILWGRVPRLYSVLDHPMEVPVQVAAYNLASRTYILPGDRVLDVGFGLGYGLITMAERAEALTGIDIDRRAVSCGQKLTEQVSQIVEIRLYDGHNIPYANKSFDVVTCIDVLEHVLDYETLLREMMRVSKHVVVISTPMRRPEYTKPDGRPMNRWHLREWSFPELEAIMGGLPVARVEWNFLDGPWEGPFECQHVVSQNTLALTPALLLDSSR